MGKATLVIMAAGIGSRFGGGIKQLEPVGPNGEIIMDYSIYDALEAGFDKVVFVIRRDLEKDFKEVIGNRIEKQVEVGYAFQELADIPAQYKDKFPGGPNRGGPDRPSSAAGIWCRSRSLSSTQTTIMGNRPTGRRSSICRR